MKPQKQKGNKTVAWLLGMILVVVFGGSLAIQAWGHSGAGSGSVGSTLVGKSAPGFTLTSTQGTVSLSRYRGRNVVLYFYEANS